MFGNSSMWLHTHIHCYLVHVLKDHQFQQPHFSCYRVNVRGDDNHSMMIHGMPSRAMCPMTLYSIVDVPCIILCCRCNSTDFEFEQIKVHSCNCKKLPGPNWGLIHWTSVHWVSFLLGRSNARIICIGFFFFHFGNVSAHPVCFMSNYFESTVY